jgi:prophage regulatory protein
MRQKEDFTQFFAALHAANPLPNVTQCHDAPHRKWRYNMEQKHPLPEEGFAKLPQVLTAIPVSKSTWFRGVAAGKYPKPVKIGVRASAWRVEEIRQCIATMSASPGNSSAQENVIAGRRPS